MGSVKPDDQKCETEAGLVQWKIPCINPMLDKRNLSMETNIIGCNCYVTLIFLYCSDCLYTFFSDVNERV